MEKTKIMLYGANGFTARLMLEKLRALPTEIILAGRNEEAIAAIAKAHNFSYRAFSLDHPRIIEKNLSDIGLVMNCAGPFSKTAVPIAKACVKARCHYFDITGEMQVFLSLYKLSFAALAHNVCLIPGMGFDIVPSDCLSKMLAEKIDGPEKLSLTIVTKNTRPSHGTLKTAFLEGGPSAIARRKEGIVKAPKDAQQKTVSLNGQSISCLRAPLADLFCAHLSTGINHIDTYLALPRQLERFGPILSLVKTLSKKPFFHRVFSAAIEKLPNGPTKEQQERGSAYIIGEMSKGHKTLQGVLQTPEPYVYTGDALLLGARHWLEYGLKPGFQTPSLAFGANFALDVSPLGTDVQMNVV